MRGTREQAKARILPELERLLAELPPVDPAPPASPAREARA
jgi:hypothetical protein